MSSERVRRKRWPWILLAAGIPVLVPVLILGVPILTHQNQGSSNQDTPTVEWPLEATATGDDGRTRVITVESATGQLDTSAVATSDRIVVTGSGYDGTRGIYVAICVIPDSPDIKPGPCIGGVPEQTPTTVDEGTIQFGPSNWINDDWAWKLFGARSYDDLEAGTFTAYIEVGDAAGENYDCRETPCGIYTRNDHTALNDRVQDLYVPIGFAD
jgi:hypothetical protein